MAFGERTKFKFKNAYLNSNSINESDCNEFKWGKVEFVRRENLLDASKFVHSRQLKKIKGLPNFFNEENEKNRTKVQFHIFFVKLYQILYLKKSINLYLCPLWTFCIFEHLDIFFSLWPMEFLRKTYRTPLIIASGEG